MKKEVMYLSLLASMTFGAISASAGMLDGRIEGELTHSNYQDAGNGIVDLEKGTLDWKNMTPAEREARYGKYRDAYRRAMEEKFIRSKKTSNVNQLRNERTVALQEAEKNGLNDLAKIEDARKVWEIAKGKVREEKEKLLEAEKKYQEAERQVKSKVAEVKKEAVKVNNSAYIAAEKKKEEAEKGYYALVDKVNTLKAKISSLEADKVAAKKSEREAEVNENNAKNVADNAKQAFDAATRGIEDAKLALKNAKDAISVAKRIEDEDERYEKLEAANLDLQAKKDALSVAKDKADKLEDAFDDATDSLKTATKKHAKIQDYLVRLDKDLADAAKEVADNTQKIDDAKVIRDDAQKALEQATSKFVDENNINEINNEELDALYANSLNAEDAVKACEANVAKAQEEANVKGEALRQAKIAAQPTLDAIEKCQNDINSIAHDATVLAEQAYAEYVSEEAAKRESKLQTMIRQESDISAKQAIDAKELCEKNQIKAKQDFEATEVAYNEASERLGLAKATLKDAKKSKDEAQIKKAEEALAKLEGAVKDLGDKLAVTKQNLKDAEKSFRSAEKDVALLSRDAEGFARMKFEQEERDAENMQIAEWRETLGENNIYVDTEAALAANEYKKALKRRDLAKKNYEKASKANSNFVVAKDDDGSNGSIDKKRNLEEDLRNKEASYKEAEVAFRKARAQYLKFFPASYEVANISDEDADKIVAEVEQKTGYKFKGDRRFLTRVLVDGEPLISYFEADKSLEEATKDALQNAIDAGYYFAGANVEDDKTVHFDKGRYGPFKVMYVDKNGDYIDANEEHRFTDEQIISRLCGKSLKEGGAFNYNEFLTRFKRLNDNPNIKKVDISFQPSKNFFYGYDGIINKDDIEDTDPRKGLIEDPSMLDHTYNRAVATEIRVYENPNSVQGSIGIDNFGSMGAVDTPVGDVDAWIVRATAQALSLFGSDHTLTLNGNVSFGTSLYGGSAGYFIPDEDFFGIGNVTLHGGYTQVNQDDVVPDVDVEGTGYYGGVFVSRRIRETPSSSLDLSLGFTYRYVETSMSVEGYELQMNNGDGYTIMPLSLALNYSDSKLDSLNGRNYGTLEVVRNMGGSALDELKNFRRAIDDENYMLARIQLARLQMLPFDNANNGQPMLFLKADGQVANGPLIGAEQYSLGGHSSVRGYAEREFMGDTGASLSIEWRSPIILGWLGERRGLESANRWQYVFFTDFGWYTLEEGLGTNEDDSQFLAGIGAGFRYAWNDRLQLRFDWGIPLVRKDDDFETSAAGCGNLSVQWQW